jgi:glycosyltransferase involved in cell wall biosynthesis
MTASAPELSIVIPAFNEASRLPRTIEDLKRLLSTRAMRAELVVSDDGSTDGTEACVRACSQRQAAGLAVTVLRSATNRGKGHAVRLGMLSARGLIRVMCDADGSMPATELPKLIEPVRRGAAQLVIGSRYLDGRRPKGQPSWRHAWSRLGHTVVQRTLVPSIQDTQCGYKAFTAAAARDIFSRATIDGWAFDLEVLALAQRLGHRVLEVSVDWTHDSRSRVRALRDLGRVLNDTLRIRSNLARGVYPRVAQPSAE